MKRRNNKGIATWLKWLLGIMAVGFVLCLATCGTVFYFGYQEVQKAMDPANCKKVVAEMVTMNDLPPNYKYAFGFDMGGMMPMVAIKNETSKITYMLIKMPNKDGENITAEQLVEQMAERGVTAPGAGGSQSTTTMEVQQKGKTKVGGVDMPYIIGTSQNKTTGKKQPAFMGCVMPNPSSAVLICAASESEGKDIDMNEVNGFLGTITGFNKASNALTP